MVKIQTADLVSCRDLLFLSLPYVASVTVLLSLLFLLPSFSASEIYKWKGKDGNMVFSDSPQSGSSEEVKIKNDMRFEIPPSAENNGLKTVTGGKAVTAQRLRDIRDIHVVLYMTDW